MSMGYNWRGLNGRHPVRRGDGRVDCEIQLKDGSWVPFTADRDDPHPQAAATLRVILAAEAAGDVTIADAPAARADDLPDLDAEAFAWLLAFTGLDDVWDAVEAEARAHGDRARYADLKARRAGGSFGFATLQAFAADPAVRATSPRVAPNADLSEAALRAAWRRAAQSGKRWGGRPPAASNVPR